MSDDAITWKRTEPTTVSKIGFRTVVTKTFKMPDGALKTWDTKEPEGSRSVATIALTDAHSNATSHFYLATGCAAGEKPRHEDGEFTTVQLITIDELFTNARTDQMSDVIAVFFAQEQLKQLQENV